METTKIKHTPTQARFSRLRAEFFGSADCTPREKRAVQSQELQVSALSKNDFECAWLIVNVFNKIKSRTGSENYPAAVEMALYMLRVGNAPLFIEATAE
ncbi:MAG: hypothetical protein U7M05_11480 [Candidatus Igneacidithiobacillus chanchocoensis]